MRVVNHRLQHDSGKPVRLIESPNRGGALRPRFVLIHYTAGRSADSAIAWLCNPAARASAHLVISREGDVTQLVRFNTTAWHAGDSRYQHQGELLQHWNRLAIGIELDNAGCVLKRPTGEWVQTATRAVFPASQVVEATHQYEHSPRGWVEYTQIQLEVLDEVMLALVNHYPIEDVLGHDDVAHPAGRKLDPGPAFPMDVLRAKLFGRANGESDRPGAPIVGEQDDDGGNA